MTTRRQRTPTLVVLALLAASSAAPTATAHRLATSRGTWTVDTTTSTVSASIAADVTAVTAVVGLAPPDTASQRPAWRREHRRAILEGFGASVTVTLAGRPCPATGVSLEGHSDEEMIVVGLRWSCPSAVAGDLHLRLHFVGQIADDHQHMATFGDDEVLVLTVDEPDYRFRFEPNAPARPVADQAATPVGFAAMVWEGITHIATGWDHIVFVLALLIGAVTLRQAIVIVTSFTIAHSLTLALSVLEVVELSSDVVEASIAATIVYVAVENIWRTEIAHRWAWALGFGLIHGLGFAGYLKELDLFADGVLWPLLSFNLGVEVGQLAIVCVTVPWMLVAAKATWWRTAKVTLSTALAGFGLYWLLERTVLS